MHMQLNTVFSTFQVKLYYLKKFLGFSDVLLLETGVSCFAKKKSLDCVCDIFWFACHWPVVFPLVYKLLALILKTGHHSTEICYHHIL